MNNQEFTSWLKQLADAIERNEASIALVADYEGQVNIAACGEYATESMVTLLTAANELANRPESVSLN